MYKMFATAFSVLPSAPWATDGLFSSFLPPEFHQCVISGDPHYRTFDHFVHHFQGRSTYTLTQTLGSLPEALVPLSVAGRNRRRLPFQRFSFLREVYVSVYGYQITLMQGRHMAVSRHGFAASDGQYWFHIVRDSDSPWNCLPLTSSFAGSPFLRGGIKY